MKHALLILTLISSICSAQVQTKYIKPIQTDPSYSSSEDSSAVSRNATSQQNKLFLFLGGTNSSSSTDYNALRLHSANLGFDFVNLSYLNSVPAASLANDTDNLAFDKYREELCFGTPVSPDVTVDSLNSIYTRTLKLLIYLDVNFPAENWGQYLLTPSTIDWSKIIVGGHSQGSGHAAFLAKQYAVDRVLMFSGPNDYSDFFSAPANWLDQTGTTATSRHFSYLSLNDEVVDYSKQFDVISALDMLINDDSTHVDNLSSPYGNSQCLYTTQPPGLVILNHNTPIKLSSINGDVWTYMLTKSITVSLTETTTINQLQLYPNPVHDFVYIKPVNVKTNQRFSIFSLSGQLLKSDFLEANGKEYKIDISHLSPGLYLLSVNGLTRRIIKE